MLEPSAPTTHVATLSFEESLRELEGLVRRLEEGRIPLKEAMTSYERGTALRRQCEKLLSEARLKIDQIVQGEEGKLSTERSTLEEMF
ncbi:MAG: exodeoxyribonuclease VII small subunit [Janthinobacterium lividum]